MHAAPRAQPSSVRQVHQRLLQGGGAGVHYRVHQQEGVEAVHHPASVM